MTESMMEKGIRCILDNCPGANEDGARYAIVSFLLALREPDEGLANSLRSTGGFAGIAIWQEAIDHILSSQPKGEEQ